MSEHSPGPWKRSSYEGGWDCVRGGEGAIICKLVLNNPANAQLIADALRLNEVNTIMLSALENASMEIVLTANYLKDALDEGREIEESKWLDGLMLYHGEMLEAIDKAKGESE